jgi:phenylalanyl-tRNA synthetase alpha chain
MRLTGYVPFRFQRIWAVSSKSVSAVSLTTITPTKASSSTATDLLRDLRRASRSDDVHFIRTARTDSTNHIHNVPPHIEQLIGTNLYLQPRHPLHTVKSLIEQYFTTQYSVTSPTLNGPLTLHTIDSLSPIVSVRDNFDELLFPPDHVGRRPSDTYYITKDTLLRTHTSAHQVPLIRRGLTAFLVTGDVYRRDAIDVTHFPVFHQMDGVRIFTADELTTRLRLRRANVASLSDAECHAEKVRIVEEDLKQALIGMVRSLFGPNTSTRWVDAYFPFTTPSFELEVFFNSKWLEVLGSGVIHPQILYNCGYTHGEIGWAFGLGLERLALVLFDIPDIRLFWSKDKRFLDQFSENKVTKFKPFSKFPPCYKDISFWISDSFHQHEFFELVREVAGNLVEDVELISEYEQPTTKRKSLCFRINYRSMERSLTNAEIDELQTKLRLLVEKRLGVQLR